MTDTEKYLIHADVTAAGVIERSDVVGAVYGQTEGLLGEDLDLRDLQQSAKVGRIDADVESADGRTVGELTVTTRLDRVETAVLAAGLETIDQIGPCRARVTVTGIEDMRAAKRRDVVDRATELLATGFDEEGLTSEELVDAVREQVRVARITEYEGLPAGPRVADSDAILVVEGRADVQTLLRYGVKNAIAVEGTDVPDAVADLTRDRTVTAFLDGDRGGDLVLRELDQVAAVDYVANAPDGKSVEDLSRAEVYRALRDKVPFEAAVEDDATPEPAPQPEHAEPDGGIGAVAASESDTDTVTDPAPDDAPAPTLEDHVDAVIDAGAGAVRLLDDDLGVIAETDAADALAAVRDAEPAPHAVVIDDAATQALLDVCAQRGVARVVAASAGEFTKQPTSVRLTTVDAA